LIDFFPIFLLLTSA